MSTTRRLKNNVIALRKSKGWNQAVLCKKARVAPSTISLIEAEATPNVAVSTVEKIALALNVHPADLLFKDIQIQVQVNEVPRGYLSE